MSKKRQLGRKLCIPEKILCRKFLLHVQNKRTQGLSLIIFQFRDVFFLTWNFSSLLQFLLICPKYRCCILNDVFSSLHLTVNNDNNDNYNML